MEVGPVAAPERVLEVEVDDLVSAVHLHPSVLVWTWEVDGVVMRMTARRSDTPPEGS